MDELLQALSNADQICKQANPHYEKASELEQLCQENLEKQKSAKKKWIIIGVVVMMFTDGILTTVLSFFPFITFIGGVFSIALGYYIGSNGLNGELESLESEKAELQKQIVNEKSIGQQIFDDHVDELSFLPVDYWYPMATDYLVKTVQSKRATNIGEAIDKYEEQLHRWKIEEANAQMVNLQQQQTAHLASIKTSSKVSAAANVTNTLFNIANKL